MKQNIVAHYKGNDGKEYQSPIFTVETTEEYLAVVAFGRILEDLRKTKA